MQFTWIVINVLQLYFVISQRSFEPEELRNWCIDADNHKKFPGSENQLHGQTSPWSDYACCTENTSKSIHTENKHRYGINRNHCPGKELSEKCNQHFIQDLSFYECEPNLGPWVVSLDHTSRKEQVFHVPLCANDCDRWFSDCENDYTCVKDWTRDFDWKNGEAYCPEHTSCKTFKEIFRNASIFCEKIWDESWKYTSDAQPCMHLWFDSSNGNLNKAVANYRINQLVDMWNGGPIIIS